MSAGLSLPSQTPIRYLKTLLLPVNLLVVIVVVLKVSLQLHYNTKAVFPLVPLCTVEIGNNLNMGGAMVHLYLAVVKMLAVLNPQCGAKL